MNTICLYNGTVISGYAMMENCSVLVRDGIIAEVLSSRRFDETHPGTDTTIIDAEGAYISPGFIDTHIHGYGGYGTDDAVYPEIRSEEETAETMSALSGLLVKHGVTAFNPTVYPAAGETMPRGIARIVSTMGKEKGARIMGLHLEGPFLSPAMLGVMRPETIRAADPAYMEALWDASGGHIVNMTVAPDIENLGELARCCNRMGIVLQAGHTNATYENMVEGMQAGILHSTHLFNAMSKLNQRNPNAVGAILTHPEFSCEIIADGIHVHPVLFKLLAANKPMDKIVLVTDSLKCTDQKSSPYYANGEEMAFKGGLFRRTKDDVIAGSGITMIKGVQNLVKFGFTLEEAVRAASSNPAAVMGYTKKGVIKPGMDADITVFDKNYSIRAVMVGGELKYHKVEIRK